MTSHYCLIGAGAAGMATLKTLHEQGFEVDCFERSHRVGGHWHDDYESLHLITSRDLSGFAGHPMPASYPVYPSRDQMLAYLEGFADEHGLRELITFGTGVVSVTPVGRRGLDGWRVELDTGKTRVYDGVLVANGHLSEPRRPDYPGTFTGKQLHAHDYHSVRDVEGSRVLVVGVGNSGCDLVVDAANARLDAHVSLRHGQVFQPKAIFGVPRAELTWLAKLPVPLQERVSRALVRVVVGPTSAYRGLPEPLTANLNQQKPVVNNLLLYWIQHGRIAVHTGIQRLDGRTVHFVDGTKADFDTIIWATGYRASLPFLAADLLHCENEVPQRVGALTVPVGLERLYLVGLAAPRGPQLPVYSAQADLVTAFLRATEADPELPLAAELTALQQPDDRIDILRPVWNKQLDVTRRDLGRILARRRTAVTPELAGSPR